MEKGSLLPGGPLGRAYGVKSRKVTVPQSWMLDSLILIFVLSYIWTVNYFELPVAVSMGWIPLIALGLVLQRRRFQYPTSPIFLASLALCILPVLKNVVVQDWAGVLESGMVLAGFGAAPLVGLYIRSYKTVLAVLLAFALPLCVLGWVVNGADMSTLFGGFVLQRAGLHPPGGTHHFLGAISGILFCVLWRRAPLAAVFVPATLIVASGARTYWFALAISFLIAEFMRLPFFRNRYLIFGAGLGVFVSLAILAMPRIGEEVDKASWTKYISFGGQDEVAKYGVFSGRNDLWNYYLTLFHQRKRTGWPTDYIRPQRVFDGDREVNEGADGELLNAATESQFDYYLARDGIWGFGAIWVFACLAAGFQQEKNTTAVMLVAFAVASAFGNSIARVTYDCVFVVWAAALWSVSFSSLKPKAKPRPFLMGVPQPAPVDGDAAPSAGSPA